MSQNPLVLSSSQTAPNFNHLPLKQETHSFNLHHQLPPWLSSEPALFTSHQSIHESQNPNPNFLSSSSSSSASFMSATALLQKAAQMGVTMSTKMAYQSSQDEANLMGRPHHHVGAPGFCATSSTSTTTAGLPSREDMGTGFLHGLASYGNKLPNLTSGCMEQLHDHINMVGSSSLPSTSGFDGSLAFDQDSFNGILNPKRNNIPSCFQDDPTQLMTLRKECGGSGGDGLTRDFLGLRAFPHRDFTNMPAAFDQMGSSSYDHHTQNQPPWQS